MSATRRLQTKERTTDNVCYVWPAQHVTVADEPPGESRRAESSRGVLTSWAASGTMPATARWRPAIKAGQRSTGDIATHGMDTRVARPHSLWLVADPPPKLLIPTSSELCPVLIKAER
jgi:hypothetical protein